MIIFHDLGKLTKRWQEGVNRRVKLPSHATVGAAYLWRSLPTGVREPVSFAVAIHHTDKGLLGDNIESPDVRAILDNIVDIEGKIEWHDKVEELDKNLFPEDAKNLSVDDLKMMARNLRAWARGEDFLTQHWRRLQVTLVHHLLKLCDVSAATTRQEHEEEADEEHYYGGWLMVENIKNYVERISARRRFWEKMMERG